MTDEFQEIGHSGGKVTFFIRTDQAGRQSYQVQFSSSRPVPIVLIEVYALPQGIVVEPMAMGGIGDVPPAPSIPGCFPVIIASDSEGRFGHQCPSCDGYWRSGPWANVCPYCAATVPSHEFFSNAQRRYVRQYCEVLGKALDSTDNADVVIDMDAVADAVGKEGERPSFYVSEESQQRKFTCTACGEFNDILGRFGYCSHCRTRCDFSDFEANTVSGIRERLNTGNAQEACVRDAVAAFDSLTAQYARQLAALVPMTKARRDRLLRRPFHDFGEVRSTLKSWFDIDVASDFTEEECRFIALKFHRRHVYEHNGGEVDEKYLKDSGDITVRLKQSLHESQEDAHRLLGLLLKAARNLHAGFHELIPPIPGPIKAFEEKRARIAKWRSENR